MNFRRSISAVALLFLLLSLSIVGAAQGRRGDESRWESLGRAYVDGRNDHDRIFVNNRASFRSLVLEVRGGSVEFQRVVVHFENGEDHQLEIADRIPVGGRTREIDLPGDRRRIRSVEFWYSKENWRSRPYVNLFGRSGPSFAERPGDESRWEMLGQSQVNGRNDHDRIFVTRRESFRALQLGVKGGAVEFQRVLVHFENGDDHALPIPDRISAGGRTRVIDLPGDRRRIRSVEFWYAKESWRSRPFVNLWGRR